MRDLPIPTDMLLTAQRNIDFFLQTFYSLFINGWEVLGIPPTGETEEQRLKRLISEKEGFIQASLVVLFNSAEIYLKSKIADKSVFLLLKDIKDAGKNVSFFDCVTIDAKDLPKIYEGISGSTLPKNFKKSYELLRTERNKVIHIGKSNSKSTSKDLIIAFLSLSEEIAKKSIVDMTDILIPESQTMSTPEINDAKEEFSGTIISILKSFFQIDEIIKETYELPNAPQSWIQCATCQNKVETLAVISRKISLCLSCGFKNGV
ncbi:TPA: hypothetical protein ACXJEC_002260 [Serratia marcescens]